jgi:hypothetical protein
VATGEDGAEVWLVEATGANSRRIAHGADDYRILRFSPRDSFLVVERSDDEGGLASSGSTEAIALRTSPGFAIPPGCAPSFSDDEAVCVFLGIGGYIQRLDRGGGAPKRIVLGRDPLVSPDASRLVFQTPEADSIWRVADIAAAEGVEIGYLETPVFAPEGGWIVGSIGGDIWRIRDDGTERFPIRVPPGRKSIIRSIGSFVFFESYGARDTHLCVVDSRNWDVQLYLVQADGRLVGARQ